MTDFYDPFSSFAGGDAPARARRPDLNEILPSLFVGEYPRAEDIAWLKQEFGISAVLSLQDDEDLSLHRLSLPAVRSACRQYEIAFSRTPVADFNCQNLADALPQALEELHTFVQGGRLFSCTAMRAVTGRQPWRLLTCMFTAASDSTKPAIFLKPGGHVDRICRCCMSILGTRRRKT